MAGNPVDVLRDLRTMVEHVLAMAKLLGFETQSPAASNQRRFALADALYTQAVMSHDVKARAELTRLSEWFATDTAKAYAARLVALLPDA